jgi:hypothetical protein
MILFLDGYVPKITEVLIAWSAYPETAPAGNVRQLRSVTT